MIMHQKNRRKNMFYSVKTAILTMIILLAAGLTACADNSANAQIPSQEAADAHNSTDEYTQSQNLTGSNGENSEQATKTADETGAASSSEAAQQPDTEKNGTNTEQATTAQPETIAPESESTQPQTTAQSALTFRNEKLLNNHYEKHGIEMGFASAKDYERAAAAVVSNPNALYKKEAEDGDDVYYVESTNEFVVVSTDGYIRTYFNPDAGISYYNRQ